jgi:predicted NAD/FAD-dependent oxidoreductase
MVIGIIGASISGLIAGKRLADAGHDVTIIEKDRSIGGRLKTVQLDGMHLDAGLTHFEAYTETFSDFIEEYRSQGILKEWTEEFSLYDGKEIYESDPNADPHPKFVGTEGLQSIADKLGRWVDIKSEEQAGGLTYIGPDRTQKRAWMINLTDISVFECDAVILATPAVEAYGLLQTVQNRTPTRRIIRHVDEVHYDSSVSLAVTYDQPVPDWDAIECEHSSVRWISNESSKQDAERASLVIQSSHSFFSKYVKTGDDKVKEGLLEATADILGPWVLQPASSYLHRWKYFESRNPIDEYFMELEMEEAPLALIGDYLGGMTLENAFVSGYNLAEYWLKKYSEVTA